MNANDIFMAQADAMVEACATILEGQSTEMVGATLTILLGEWLAHYETTSHESLLVLNAASALRWVELRKEMARTQAKQVIRRRA